MVRALLAGQMVAQDLVLLLLDLLLQCGLVVHVMELRHRHIAQHKGADKAQRRLIAAVQVTGGNDTLHRIGQNGIAGPAAEALLAVAQQQEIAQADAPCDQCQALLADHIRPHPGQLALGTVREIPVQVVSDDHAQDGISQKLQPLVAAQGIVPALVGVGGVGQGVLQQRDVPEAVADGLLQFMQHIRQSPLRRRSASEQLPAPRQNCGWQLPWPGAPHCGRPAGRRSRGP